jgi:hypothetical protein
VRDRRPRHFELYEHIRTSGICKSTGKLPAYMASSTSLGHSHYAAASYVARLICSRSSPTVPSQWPRNLQIISFVNENSMDQLLRRPLSRRLLHIYVFGVFKFFAVCSVEGGCLRALFDCLAEGGLYAECFPEIISSDYPVLRVYVVPLGGYIIVPRFLTKI